MKCFRMFSKERGNMISFVRGKEAEMSKRPDPFHRCLKCKTRFDPFFYYHCPMCGWAIPEEVNREVIETAEAADQEIKDLMSLPNE